MPPYLILNNRELAELAMKKPASLAKLREIEGIGEAKSQRWGEEILALLAKLAAPQDASPCKTPEVARTAKAEVVGRSETAPERVAVEPATRKTAGGVAHDLRRAKQPAATPFTRSFWRDGNLPPVLRTRAP